jgi:hypothetical protein
MPVHNWTRVDAGTFHAFHTAWITHLSETLNGGLLPSGYYALPEQHAGRPIADVLTLHTGQPMVPAPPTEGGLAIAEAPPRVSRREKVAASAASRQRSLAIRHVSGHRIIALLEIVSPANKDRARHIADFAAKMVGALVAGVHLLVIDLFARGPHDPLGIHGAIFQQLDEEADVSIPPPDAPLTLVGYVAGEEVEAHLEFTVVNAVLPDMPLFLSDERYIYVPLEATYDLAFRGLPAFWRNVLEQ